MKKSFRLLLCVIILLCLSCTGLFACTMTNQPSDLKEEPTLSPQKEKTKMLFLGDSIGEAMAGPTPLTEREAYGYYGIIGNINDYEYYNRSVTAYTTADLMRFVTREDDGVNMVKSLIAGADIIHISILGNDFLNSSHTQMMLDISEENYERVTARQIRATENLDQTLSTIRELNPDAVILLQTLYNPTGPDSPLITSYARTALAKRGIDGSSYHALMDKMIVAINQILSDYLEEHTVTDPSGRKTAPFETVDVYSAFESVYQSDRARWAGLFCADGIHPHNEGHAIIAECIQKKLEELSLAAPNALHNYKKDKVSQLKRLFGGMTDADGVRANIMRATDFAGVNEAYFRGTDGLTPAYAEQPVLQGETFPENERFDISLLRIFHSGLAGVLNQKQSYIEFRADGSYELSVTFTPLVAAAIRTEIKEKGSIDLNRSYPIELALDYVSNIAPGIERTDLKGLAERLKSDYGIEIIGIDFEKECVKETLDRFRQTERLVLDDPDILDKVIAIKCTGRYRLKEVHSSLTDETYLAIYVNNAIGRGESYVRYTFTENEIGDKKVRMTIDVARLELEGEADAEE